MTSFTKYLFTMLGAAETEPHIESSWYLRIQHERPEFFIDDVCPTCPGADEGEVICPWPPLTGDQEVPPNATNASGQAVWRYNPATGVVTLRVVHNVMAPTSAHMHQGAPGVNGPAVMDLGDPASPIIATMTLGDYNTFLYDHYINIHSEAFPDGEIRGDMDCGYVPEPGEGEGASGP